MLWFTLPGDPALLDGLSEADLPMADHFVADLEIIERQPRSAGVRIYLRALTIAEA